MRKFSLCLLLILFFSYLSNSQTILLDTTFGTGGKVTTGLNLNNAGTKLALQSDGKTIVVGGNTNGDFVVARYNTDGTPDNSFGTTGVVTTDFGSADNASGVVIAQDGKIVACGTSTDLLQARGADFSVARYNSDGSLNIAFANNGQLVYDFLGLNNYAYALAIQPDGRIIVVGSLSRNIEALPGVMAIFR